MGLAHSSEKQFDDHFSPYFSYTVVQISEWRPPEGRDLPLAGQDTAC